MATGTDFSLPATLDEVARSLSTTRVFLKQLTDPVKKFKYYRPFDIKKKRGGYRRVWCCELDEVATLHKTFARRLSAFAVGRTGGFPSPIAHGYVPLRSTTTNAQVHCGAQKLLRIDVANFFGSISESRVVRVLAALGVSKRAAKILASFSTLEGVLPLGLHASPVVANLVCMDLDRDLVELADRSGAKVTRYADDIAFSGDAVPQVADVASILLEHGFTLNPAKCRVSVRGRAHFVTGLAISDDVPRIPRRRKARLRQELHFIKKYGLEEHRQHTKDDSKQRVVNRIEGTLRYFNAVEPALAAKLRVAWKAAVPGPQRFPAFASQTKAGQPMSVLIDEAKFDSSQGPVMAIGMVLTTRVEEVETKLARILRAHLIDPYSTGDKEALQKKGLHAADNSEDLKTRVFEALETLPVRCYVAYDLCSGNEHYQKLWLTLLNALLVHRLMYADGADVSIMYEENPRVSRTAVQRLVDDTYSRLEADDNRRPRHMAPVSVGTKKDNICLASADYLLAGFQQFANLNRPQEGNGRKEKRGPGEQAAKRFDRLRDRIRLIRSLATDENFTRSNPFRPWPEGRPKHEPSEM